MADVKDITPDLDKLDYQIDNLEDALEPLLENLEDLSSKLPLLDKAKLFSLTAYAIESMLFCKPSKSLWVSGSITNASKASLRIEGSDAQNHAVYEELKRIQQYFAKIKAAEEPAGQRTTTVNQEAAARILKADLVRSLLHMARDKNHANIPCSPTTKTSVESSQKRLPRSARRLCLSLLRVAQARRGLLRTGLPLPQRRTRSQVRSRRARGRARARSEDGVMPARSTTYSTELRRPRYPVPCLQRTLGRPQGLKTESSYCCTQLKRVFGRHRVSSPVDTARATMGERRRGR